MPSTSFYGNIPAEHITPQDPNQADIGADAFGHSDFDQQTLPLSQLTGQVVNWRNVLWQNRWLKRNIWDECWALYRGVEDFSDKEDWQSRVTIPKAWSSVKQATNVIKRLLSVAKEPWQFDPTNPDDLILTQKAEQNTHLLKVFLEKAKYIEHFSEGLECGFIMGLGVWKLWWGLEPRIKNNIQAFVDPATGQPQRQMVQEEILEGRIQLRAVDPYHFFWLPGSRLNHWTGTVEQIEVPRWELLEMADKGIFDKELVKKISEARLNPQMEQSQLRFNELPFRGSNLGSNAARMVRLTEYYGPLLDSEGNVIEANAHVLIGGDSVVLLATKNPFLHRRPPYVAFSPLSLPFRTEGTGLIEMVRDVDHAINKLARMSMDTLLFRLMPTFEVPIDVYENPEDFETGITPGKIFRRNLAHVGVQGLTPIQMEDISTGTVQIAGQLDRAHQEGALVSEIQQGLPRFRGSQTATEVNIKEEQQQSFFGNMAVEIEEQALKPMIMMAWDLLFQYIDTANDPRVAAILGQHADVVRGMTREEIQEIIQGDYELKVTGISQSLQKAEMLQNLIQLMNLIGQNSEAWLPYVNQDALLRRIMEAFRPGIRDVEDIIADPATVAAKQAAMQQQQMNPDILRMMPAMMDAKHQQEKVAVEQKQEQQNQQLQAVKMMLDFELEKARIELEKAQAQEAKAKAAKANGPGGEALP